MSRGQRVCPRCRGEGEIPAPDPSGAATAVCPTCHGRTWLNVNVRPAQPRDEKGGATADAIMGLTVVAVALTPKSVLPTGTWLPLLAVVFALATVVIIAGMRREP